MTLILNVLHSDISILAADRIARPEWPVSPMSIGTATIISRQVFNGFNKISMNSSNTFAVGIAGYTHDHCYTKAIEQSESIEECLHTIREHIESFVPTYDRARLSRLKSFIANEGIATFFDQSMAMYFTSRYLFSPIEIRTRLHRAADEVQVFSAGSGKSYFAGEEGLAGITSFTAAVKNSCTPEACISWMQDAYKRVAACEPDIGADPVFVVSTRSNPEFRSI